MSSKHDKSSRPFISNLEWFEPDTKQWWKDRWVVLAVAAVVFLPLLGSFGLWDPWETHYGEVARNILAGNDWISTWWGSHWKDAAGQSEGNYFFSKPILLMWMMAMGMKIFGFSAWGIRIGVALVGMLGVVLAYSFGASVFGRRTGFLMAAVVGTSPFWFFLSRQAQTDMPFVGLMTVGMCFFLMAMFGADRHRPADKFSYALAFGWLALVCIPQISLVLVGLSSWRGGPNGWMEHFTSLSWKGVPYGVIFGGSILIIGFVLFLVGLFRGRGGSDRGRALRRWFAMGGLAVIWGPLAVVLGIILFNGSSVGHDLNGWFIWGPTQAAIYTTCFGGAIYLPMARPVVARKRLYLLPFYIFVGLATLAKGLLGFMLPGAVVFFYILITREWRMLKEVDLHIGAPAFVAVTFPWYAAMLIRHTHGFWTRFFVHDHFKRLASGVHQIDTGSFEHFLRWLGYGLFPWVAFLPATAGHILSGKYLHMDDDRGRAKLMLVLWAVVAFTLFTLSSTKFHHYIFPAVPALAMLIAITLDDAVDGELAHPWPLFLVGAGVFGIVLWDVIDDPEILKNLFTYKYRRRWDASWNSAFRWMIVGVSVPGLAGVLLFLSRSRRIRRWSLAAMFASSVAFAVFCLDIYMPEISSTWSQKGLWDAYYRQCTRTKGPPEAHRFKRYCEEPAIAYKLNWRGETFYTQNEVIPVADDSDWDYFIDQQDNHPFYGIMEGSRFRGGFQRALPDSLKGKACVTWDKNIKFVLVKVPCGQDNPNRVDF